MRTFCLITLFCFSLSPIFSQTAIKGTVLNKENDEPITGAAVTLKGSYSGLYTDKDGQFELKLSNPDPTITLQISHLGFEDQERTIVVKPGHENEVLISLAQKAFLADEVVVSATRANRKTATTYTEMSEEEIEKRNLGQDLPYIINQTPSVVSTSDAGAGVGYTSLRIRGSDQTRINVTINGIPYNDSESQGVFWVNLPDFASSVDNIQIQRGIGTSTNGAAAFGATVNVQTIELNEKPYGELSGTYGSFNTWKTTAKLGTGLIKNKFTFDGRLSKIKSNGYIERASSDLGSYFLSGGYYGKRTILRINAFAGKEETYQAWWGVPEDSLATNRRWNYYDYENEIDHYEQNNYQAILSQEVGKNWLLNAALHYTRGRGYFEQYQGPEHNNAYGFNSKEAFTDYGLENIPVGIDQADVFQQLIIGADTLRNIPVQDGIISQIIVNGDTFNHVIVNPDLANRLVADNDSLNNAVDNDTIDNVFISGAEITKTSLIRRRWLDNHFYGLTFSANYSKNNFNFIIGGAANRYVGDHFGEIIWAEYASNGAIRHRFYDNTGLKTDANIYAKASYTFFNKLSLFADIQYRLVKYEVKGVDIDQRNLSVDEQLHFINPKVGLSYAFNSSHELYASLAVGNREPVRDDYIDAPAGVKPKHESMTNLEIGYVYRKPNNILGVNYYLMYYKNQLVLTGALNDVGGAIRTNVDKSYRTGFEIYNKLKILDKLFWDVNLTLSMNRIVDFTEVLNIYDANYDLADTIQVQYGHTDISFSPPIIAGSVITYEPVKNLEFSLLSKYVARQYLDNTANSERQLSGYFVNDFRFSYTLTDMFFREITFTVLVNNIFNTKYESNGYTFRETYEPDRSTVYHYNYYYPQATINVLGEIQLKF